LLERFGDPGVVVFYDEFDDLCTFAGWKGLELLMISVALILTRIPHDLFAAKSMFFRA
jgi:hypothetical protein